MSIKFPINLRWLSLVKPIEPVEPDPKQSLTIFELTILQDKGHVLIAQSGNNIYLMPNQEIINVIWAFENNTGNQYSSSELLRLFGAKDFETLIANLTNKFRVVRASLETRKIEETAAQATSNVQHVNEPVENVLPDDIPSYLNDVPVFEERI